MLLSPGHSDEGHHILILNLEVVPTYNIVILVFIQSSALEQMAAIHSGMAAEFAGLVSNQAKPLQVYSQKVMSGG
ncbi:hypothetical protein TNCV_4060661 [Trichonephila clavipes]|nr:hypothetical protein TNCV_4060661 [Trichonephila clavipes]